MQSNYTPQSVPEPLPWDTTSDRLYTIRRFDHWMIKRSGNQQTIVVWRMDDHERGPAWCEIGNPAAGDRDLVAAQVADAVHAPTWLIDEIVDVMSGGPRTV